MVVPALAGLICPPPVGPLPTRSASNWASPVRAYCCTRASLIGGPRPPPRLVALAYTNLDASLSLAAVPPASLGPSLRRASSFHGMVSVYLIVCVGSASVWLGLGGIGFGPVRRAPYALSVNLFFGYYPSVVLPPVVSTLASSISPPSLVLLTRRTASDARFVLAPPTPSPVAFPPGLDPLPRLLLTLPLAVVHLLSCGLFFRPALWIAEPRRPLLREPPVRSSRVVAAGPASPYSCYRR
ncbi:unnamed protein product [Dovyalis caffra]|uniref:Uncharacterized protein n=1 Tax=Dovyalis caffra TaxID=77055 RepID=A0AAV1QVR8_9ROSI|nr:unnamed protein product [Dovyalis caffra]